MLVAEADEAIVGWATLHQHNTRSANRYTVQSSVYVDSSWHRRGVGKRLMSELISKAKALGYCSIVAGADSAQDASIRLHLSLGFRPVGRLERVGFKFGRWLNVVWMQLHLQPG